MNEKEIEIAQAALEMFLKYGIGRTTMNDIATAAGMTRQSLYNSFENKEAVLCHAVDYFCMQQIEKAVLACAAEPHFDAQFRRCLEHFLIENWEIAQATPEIAEIESGAWKAIQPVLDKAVQQKSAFLSSMLQPYHHHLKQHNLTCDSLAEVILSAIKGIKNTAHTKAELNRQSEALTILVLGIIKPLPAE